MTRKFMLVTFFYYAIRKDRGTRDVNVANRHIGFEKWSLKNIDAVLKGNEPLTPVNKHLMVAKAKAML